MNWFMRLAIVPFTAISAFGVLLTCNAAQQTEKQDAQVLFICEHGTVKSLMAASYFNRLASADCLTAPWRVGQHQAQWRFPQS